MRDADITLTCRQCNKEFILTKAEQEFYEMKGFSLPSRCKECRTTRQSQPHHRVCSQCGTEIVKEAAVYCDGCLENAQLGGEQKARQFKMAVSAAKTKLEASESQKAEFAELLRQKEQLVTELELKVNSLIEDLDKTQQFYAASGWLQPVLGEMEKRLEDLELAQREINQKMLQTIRVLCESYDNVALWDVIKRSLRQNQKQSA